ncbi:MAG: Clp protease N-terminal domain-containing protein [Anaerolineae bacterium]
MNRMERFSPAARDILSRAAEQAVQLKDGVIRLPHMLLAMLNADHSTKALEALTAAGIQYASALDLIAKLPPLSPSADKPAPDLSEQVKRMIEESVRITREQNAHVVGDDHLLRGLLAVQDKFLFDTLTGLGSTPEKILEHLNRITQTSGDFPTETPSVSVIEEQVAKVDRLNPLEDRTVKISIKATAPIEPGDWVARFPFQTLLDQFAYGADGRIRLVMDDFQIEISFE